MPTPDAGFYFKNKPLLRFDSRILFYLFGAVGCLSVTSWFILGNPGVDPLIYGYFAYGALFPVGAGIYIRRSSVWAMWASPVGIVAFFSFRKELYRWIGSKESAAPGPPSAASMRTCS